MDLIQENLEDMRKNWYWFLIVGVICIIGGIFALNRPFLATLTVEIIAAWVFIIAGVAQIFQGFQSKMEGRGWLITIGILMTILGIVLIMYPQEGVFSLTAAVATILFIGGIAQCVFAFQLRPATGWGWLLFAGIVSIALSVLIFSDFEQMLGYTLGTFLAVDLLMQGFLLVFAAFSIKKA